jgi:CBS domain-containing protein
MDKPTARNRLEFSLTATNESFMTVVTLRQILADSPLHQVAPQTPVAEAAALMARVRGGALAVLEGARLAGIVSERDIVFRLVAERRPATATAVAEIMTADPITLQVGEPVSGALAAKLGDAFRHLPVLDGDRVVGLISYRDVPAEFAMLFERFRGMKAARADG